MELNKDWIAFHLEEAKEELERTLSDLATETDYGAPEFQVAISHLYHHVNTAWNARFASLQQVQSGSKVDFDAWRKFPSDIAP